MADIDNSSKMYVSGIAGPRLRRVVIEERQEKVIEHARLAAGYSEDLNPHAHDQATFRLINRRKEFDQLAGAEQVMPMLDNWDYWTKMNDWDSRNHVLEDLTGKMRRREATEAEIHLIVTLCRPAWRAVTVSLARHSWKDLDISAGGVYQREAARRANELDHAELDWVVQSTCVDLLCSCPSPFPRRFFGWLRGELAGAALKHLRAELTTDGPSHLPRDYNIVTVLDQVFAGEGHNANYFEAQASPGHSAWLRTLDIPAIFELAGQYALYLRRETAVARAVDRLPARQRQIIQQHYYDPITQAQIARDRGVTSSTARNNHAKALINLERDNELFLVLEAIGDVRDADRRDSLSMNSNSLPDCNECTPDGGGLGVIGPRALTGRQRAGLPPCYRTATGRLRTRRR